MIPRFAKRPEIMAILNVTPDSFSDGGLFDTTERAVEQALKCEAEGASIIDIGAESTRPGHTAISAQEELDRLGPILKALNQHLQIPISVDTYKAEVARFSAKAGAAIINDVWGLQRDPEMPSAVAEAGTDIVIMHNRFDGADETIDILDDMDRWFDKSLNLARQQGITDEKIILDPGIGFGKTFQQNLIVLANLDRLKQYGHRTLMGLSRKRFIGAILDAETDQRLFGTLSANIHSLYSGMDIIRVHDVKPHREALDVLMVIDEVTQSAQ